MDKVGYCIAIMFFLLGVFLLYVACYHVAVDENGRIKEVAGHIYIWKIGDGYVHDDKCPSCK